MLPALRLAGNIFSQSGKIQWWWEKIKIKQIVNNVKLVVANKHRAKSPEMFFKVIGTKGIDANRSTS